jgi:hypothetical protein
VSAYCPCSGLDVSPVPVRPGKGCPQCQQRREAHRKKRRNKRASKAQAERDRAAARVALR